MEYYGAFDEENRARDMIPDKKVRHLAMAVSAYVAVRITGVFAMAYDKTKTPMSGLSWRSPFKIGAWICALQRSIEVLVAC